MLAKWDDLDFTPTCTKQQLECQYAAMVMYEVSLRNRNDFTYIQAKAESVTE